MGRLRLATRALHGSSPSADAVDATATAVSNILDGDTPLVAGPWFSEVGFELLYWIPFLRWIVRQWPGAAERMSVVSRGGTSSWYSGVASNYVDVLDLFDPDEYMVRRERAIADLRGKQKQTAVTSFDREILHRAAARLHLPEGYRLLHPSLVYRLYKSLWKVHEVPRFLDIARHERIHPPAVRNAVAAFPAKYAAIRFYSSDALPETPQTRVALESLVEAIAQIVDVVLLDPGLRLDDHSTFRSRARVHLIDELVRPQDNLAVQTSLVAGARAFVGTYGGLSYLAPMLGVPAVGIYARPDAFHATHLDLAQRVFAQSGFGQLQALDIGSSDTDAAIRAVVSDQPAG